MRGLNGKDEASAMAVENASTRRSTRLGSYGIDVVIRDEAWSRRPLDSKVSVEMSWGSGGVGYCSFSIAVDAGTEVLGGLPCAFESPPDDPADNVGLEARHDDVE